ncbi:MAG: NAD(P)H-dependent oxidoreductase [Candidatus Pelagadaptatus aseana]|uniref:flavodoxin family protein n=1 Tax=Candidatus Pelagadaptatus aseana TaxID=3120508 RepID=UPI0039B2BF7E
MKKLLLIAHAPSDNTRNMVNAVVSGANSYESECVEIQHLPPLETQPEDLLSAQAVILGTTENLGYMSGALKDMFDRCYYPCLEQTQGLPFAYFIRAGHDGTGTRRAIDTITTGLRWKTVQKPLICRGDFQPEFLEQCQELGLSMAASLDAGII